MVTIKTPRLKLFGLGFLALFLTWPIFLIAPWMMWKPSEIDLLEIFWALQNSLILGIGGVIVSLLLAISITPILLLLRSFSSPLFKLVQVLLTAPLVLPSFFILLVFLDWWPGLAFGAVTCAIILGFHYAGFLAVQIEKELQNYAALSELSEVLGAKSTLFFRGISGLLSKALWPQLVLIFVFCFSSFSVPLIVAGSRGTTLEVLIFEKVKINSDFGSAIWLSLIQIAILALVFGLSEVFSLTATNQKSSIGEFRHFKNWFSVLPLMAYLTFIYKPWFYFNIESLANEMSLRTAALNSLWIMLFCFVLSYLMLTFCSFLFFQSAHESSTLTRLRRRFFQYWPLSTSVIGLGCVLGAEYFSIREIPYVVGFVGLVLPGLLKLGFQERVVKLRTQVDLATVLGASDFLIWSKIIYPQFQGLNLALSGFVAIWSLGDFSLAKFVLPSEATLPMVIEALMSSYRIEQAISLGSLVLWFSVLVLFILGRLEIVTNKRAH